MDTLPLASINAFHIAGVILALWAVTVTALGVTRENFPASRGQARLVGAISVVLAAGAISSAIIVGATEGNKKESHGAEAKAPPPAPSGGEGGGSQLQLAADPSGQFKFDKTSLEAAAGTVTITMKNASPVGHDVSVEGAGIDQKGKVVQNGGTSTVKADLKAGSYTFYCSVDAHRQAGMKGTLTVK